MDFFEPKKRFGQNFLIDDDVVDKISDLVGPNASDYILEIGPGTGVVTEKIVNTGAIVHAIEIDENLCARLDQKFLRNKNFFLHKGDFLKFNLNELGRQSTCWKVVGNLPYNIATRMIFHLLGHPNLFSKMILMTQLEVAERMVAKPNSGDYGRLSIMLQRQSQVELRHQVENDSFYPKPKVTSSILEIKPKKPLSDKILENQIDTITRTAFNNRRKTITNSLRQFFSRNDILSCGLDPKSRAENLSIKDYEKLARWKLLNTSNQNIL